MHESFRRRLEVEEARKLQDGEPYMININFMRPRSNTIVRSVSRALILPLTDG